MPTLDGQMLLDAVHGRNHWLEVFLGGVGEIKTLPAF